MRWWSRTTRRPASKMNIHTLYRKWHEKSEAGESNKEKDHGVLIKLRVNWTLSKSLRGTFGWWLTDQYNFANRQKDQANRHFQTNHQTTGSWKQDTREVYCQKQQSISHRKAPTINWWESSQSSTPTITGVQSIKTPRPHVTVTDRPEVICQLGLSLWRKDGRAKQAPRLYQCTAITQTKCTIDQRTRLFQKKQNRNVREQKYRKYHDTFGATGIQTTENQRRGKNPKFRRKESQAREPQNPLPGCPDKWRKRVKRRKKIWTQNTPELRQRHQHWYCNPANHVIDQEQRRESHTE